MAHELLESKSFPDRKLLNDLCQEKVFGRKSTVAIDTCKKICLFIKSLNTNIIDVWPARKAVTLTKGETFDIRFVVITENLNEEGRNDLENLIQSYYDTLPLRDCDHLSSEETYLMKERGYKFREDDQNRINACITLHADSLLQKHTYLGIISGCPFRSVGYDTSNHKIVATPCIVLNVQYKGYIPIDEEPFERQYDGVQVDVREDIFVLYNYTAKERHDNVKAGCQISGETDERGKCPKGTLGGFVNHPDYGLCGISCSHVLLRPNELSQIAGESQEINWSRSTLPAGRNVDTWQGNVYQPSKVETSKGNVADDNKIGRLVKVIYRRGKTSSKEMDQCGIDAALFQLSNRLPITSDFPAVKVSDADISPEGTNIDSEHREIPVQFGTGTIGGFAWHDQKAYSKYGAITGYTVGELFDCSIAVKEPFNWTHAKSFKYILHNQLSLSKANNGRHDISPLDRPEESSDYFAFEGDSGSLVHHETTDGKLVCVGIVVGGRKSQKTCIITPILPVLKAMGISDFKNFDSERMESNVKKMVVEMKTINTNIENMDKEMKDGFTNISEQLNTMQNTGMRCVII
ncbi:uncharacterized protein LOC123526661 [Mercenaria mercenaria]|uniref:uncharacterized protein LOC123526661 n=1 Tax=Mercenaria mercenaria TaxID=6596 RepID=UPI00234EBFAE|nr:uncharacterized protein LOC123526661 [Mercenaria mercenaria]